MLKARKKEVQLRIKKILENDEVIETWINGKYETQKLAKAGEYVVIGTQREEYAIDPETFHNRYEIKGDMAYSKPVKIDFEYATEDMTFIASWGSEINILKDDILVYENDKLSYGIARNAFEETYESITTIPDINKSTEPELLEIGVKVSLSDLTENKKRDYYKAIEARMVELECSCGCNVEASKITSID